MSSTIRRYTSSPIIGLGEFYGTSYMIPNLRENLDNGSIRYKEIILKEGMRLDILAGIEYGDGRLFWIIAAASGIGYATAALPGTVIKVPNLNDVVKFI